MTKPESSFDTFLREWNLKSLHESDSPPPLQPPSSPSFAQLVHLDAENPPSEAEHRGLFSTLLGRPEALYLDSVKHPEKYSAETLALLAELASGAKKLEGLSREERRLLDLGTVDFATASPRARRPRPAPPRAAARATPRAPAEPVPGVDVPLDAPAPYWWLK